MLIIVAGSEEQANPLFLSLWQQGRWLSLAFQSSQAGGTSKHTSIAIRHFSLMFICDLGYVSKLNEKDKRWHPSLLFMDYS